MNNDGSQIGSLAERKWMRRAVTLARRGYGQTSPNPMVGAILVQQGRIIGEGYHHRAGLPHAEIEALNDAASRGESCKGATLVVTLEPCSTHGRTPPCTETIIKSGIARVVAGASDPNPKHAGRGFNLLRDRGLSVIAGVEESRCLDLNKCFNHWIVNRTPYITAKCAMTLDGRIATESGESKWITGSAARMESMRLRKGADAVLVGVNTVIADDPQLSVRMDRRAKGLRLYRIILDPGARIPLAAKVLNDEDRDRTIIVVAAYASPSRLAALRERVEVLSLPSKGSELNLAHLLRALGERGVLHLVIEGGGETHARFFKEQLPQEVMFFYAPKVLGGIQARRGVGGPGAMDKGGLIPLINVSSRLLGGDLLVRALCQANQ